jgi:predicted anti-sigma-YlaC factor YlaD
MLKFKLLTCQQVATLASDYLDQQADGKLTFKIRVHLMMCANCRRFVKHLKITTQVVPQLSQGFRHAEVDAEAVLKRIKARQ